MIWLAGVNQSMRPEVGWVVRQPPWVFHRWARRARGRGWMAGFGRAALPQGPAQVQVHLDFRGEHRDQGLRVVDERLPVLVRLGDRVHTPGGGDARVLECGRGVREQSQSGGSALVHTVRVAVVRLDHVREENSGLGFQFVDLVAQGDVPGHGVPGFPQPRIHIVEHMYESTPFSVLSQARTGLLRLSPCARCPSISERWFSPYNTCRGSRASLGRQRGGRLLSRLGQPRAGWWRGGTVPRWPGRSW